MITKAQATRLRLMIAGVSLANTRGRWRKSQRKIAVELKELLDQFIDRLTEKDQPHDPA